MTDADRYLSRSVRGSTRRAGRCVDQVNVCWNEIDFSFVNAMGIVRRLFRLFPRIESIVELRQKRRPAISLGSAASTRRISRGARGPLSLEGPRRRPGVSLEVRVSPRGPLPLEGPRRRPGGPLSLDSGSRRPGGPLSLEVLRTGGPLSLECRVRGVDQVATLIAARLTSALLGTLSVHTARGGDELARAYRANETARASRQHS